jgi:putative MATE family efflux protein
MNTPESVMPHALDYFNMYFAGVSTVIMYNTCMSIMRAVGDSVRPLYYLLISSVVNVVLDILFVAVFGWGAGGAAFATVIAQGISVLLCLIRMCSGKDAIKIQLSYFKFDKSAMVKIIRQGLPGGIQNTVNSIGNMVVQSCINTFGAFAISGYGAFHKVEGIAFLPIMSMCMALPTFVSQNLGAGEVARAKKGSFIGIFMGCVFAEVMGLFLYFMSPYLIGMFVNSPEAIAYGVGHGKTVAFFLFLLGFTHCAAGPLRGCGKAMIPMVTLLVCWCGIRILYVTTALKFFPVFQTISRAYPLTWGLSAVILLVCLLRLDWKNARV